MSSSPSKSSASSRVVIVTGAGKGLGAAFAEACAARGDRVVVNNRVRAGAPDEAGAVADAIRRAGGLAVAERSDVSSPGASEAIVAAALEAFGRLDAVIFNAGITGPAEKFDTLSLDVFDEVFETNLRANVRLAKAALPSLHASPAGRMVFVSSSAGLYGVKGRSAYAASKAALSAFALTLADETRRAGIGVNVLAPYAETRMTADTPLDPDVRALLAPERAAAAAAWLAGPDCGRTGEIWLAGAGWLRRARTVETYGAPSPALALGEAMEAAARTAEIDAEPRGFTGGEAAFADFFAAARRSS